MLNACTNHSFNMHSIAIRVLMVLMGLLIVLFNVMGYEVLFDDSPFTFFPISSPMGLLLFIAEAAVLVWTSAVIANWPNTSKILKSAMAFIVPIFWFICYVGISSYLSFLATSNIDDVRQIKLQVKNNVDLIDTMSGQVSQIQRELTTLRELRNTENQKIKQFNQAIDDLSIKASERRQTAANCTLVDDCRASVKAFETQMNRMELELEPIRTSRDRITARIFLLEDKLDGLTQAITDSKLSETQKLNTVADKDSNYEVKKQAYADATEGLLGIFGISLKDPFQVFINILALVIYPLYFLLNMYTSLQSPANVKQRKLRYASKRAEESIRNKLYQKLVAYFRVWAHRRKKVIQVPKEIIVEKLVEVKVPVEVEKIVLKEVEVPIEVEKIVKVPTEVPVYINKIETVPEKELVFVENPEIIIHERMVPVPENISGVELQEMLNAQPRFNQVSKGSEEQVSDTEGNEGVKANANTGAGEASSSKRHIDSEDNAAA